MPITDESFQTLQQLLVQTLEFAEKEMTSRKDWGAINFSEAQDDLKAAIDVASALKDMPFQALHESIGVDIVNHLEAVNNALAEIDGFSIEQADPANVRTEISGRLKTAADNLSLLTGPWLAFLAYKRGDIAKTIADLESAVAKAEDIGAEAKLAMEQLKKEAENILVNIRQAAAESGVEVFTEQFATEATNRDKSATQWLVVTVAGAVLTAGAAFLFLDWPELPDDPTNWDMGRIITTKIALLALLFTATVWCSKNYRALKHQVTVNKHRALSLQTFQAFVGATKDPRTKDAVLMEATRAIFGNTATGFADPAHTSESGIQFLQIGKSVAEKAADEATS